MNFILDEDTWLIINGRRGFVIVFLFVHDFRVRRCLIDQQCPFSGVLPLRLNELFIECKQSNINEATISVNFLFDTS